MDPATQTAIQATVAAALPAAQQYPLLALFAVVVIAFIWYQHQQQRHFIELMREQGALNRQTTTECAEVVKENTVALAGVRTVIDQLKQAR